MRKLRLGWVKKAPGHACNMWLSSNLKLKAKQVKATDKTFKALRKPTDSRLAAWLLVGEGLAKSLIKALKIPETFRVSLTLPGAVWFKHFPHWEWSRDLRHFLLSQTLNLSWEVVRFCPCFDFGHFERMAFDSTEGIGTSLWDAVWHFRSSDSFRC